PAAPNTVNGPSTATQPKVEDNTVAAAANATAPTTNSPPVVRRSPPPVLVGAISAPPLMRVNIFCTVYKSCTLSRVKSREEPDRWQHRPSVVVAARGGP